MIPVYRKMRKKLADKDKILMYSRYAFGEIVLVVIGILIALQINNWNEDRKLRKIEVKLLRELKNDLNVTLEELNLDIPNLEKQMKLADRLIEFAGDQRNKDLTPERFLDSFGYFNWNVKLYPRTIAYQNLSSMGIDLFSNDSVRYLTADIFERRLTRVSLWENKVGEKGELFIQKMSEEFVSYDYLEAQNSNGRRRTYLYAPQRFEDLYKNKPVLNALANMQNDRVMQLLLYQDLKQSLRKLIQMIDEELNYESKYSQ